MPDRFPIIVSSPAPSGTMRELDVLRILGRLGPMLTTDLGVLVLPGASSRTRQYLIQDLLNRKWIWRRRTNLPNRWHLSVCGLTSRGREQLAMRHSEPDEETLRRLLVNDPKSSSPPPPTLSTDLTISGWCAAVLAELRKLPQLVGVIGQAQWTTAVDAQHYHHQTLDAGIVACLDPKQTHYNRSPASIPWLTSSTLPTTWKCRAWALRVYTEYPPDTIVRADAMAYPVLAQNGTYTRLMHCTPLPVIVLPADHDLATVAQPWQEAWPQTNALITTTDRVNHPMYGPLCGHYRAVTNVDGPDVTLLENLIGSVEKWAELTRNWTPDRETRNQKR